MIMGLVIMLWICGIAIIGYCAFTWTDHLIKMDLIKTKPRSADRDIKYKVEGCKALGYGAMAIVTMIIMIIGVLI